MFNSRNLMEHCTFVSKMMPFYNRASQFMAMLIWHGESQCFPQRHKYLKTGIVWQGFICKLRIKMHCGMMIDLEINQVKCFGEGAQVCMIMLIERFLVLVKILTSWKNNVFPLLTLEKECLKEKKQLILFFFALEVKLRYLLKLICSFP